MTLLSFWLWDWFKQRPWTVGIAIAIFVAAVVTTIIAIATKGGWKDKGFMKAPESGKPLQWRKDEVIGLFMHPDVPLFWAATISAVVRRFNQAIGRDMFTLPITAPPDYDWNKPPPKGVVTFKCDPTLENKATTEHRYVKETGELLSAEVTFPVESTMRMAMGTHEVGHVCGLDHDEHPDSIMYPSLSTQKVPGTLSTADEKRLAAAYGS